MTKPIQDNIRNVRIEDENGDLIPVLDAAGQEFSEVEQASTEPQQGLPGVE